jgi:hypothetical protein
MSNLVARIAFLAMLAASAAAHAQNDPATRMSLKGITGVAVRIDPVAPDAQRDGLLAEGLRASVEARLRKGGITLITSEEQNRLPNRPGLEISVATSKLNTGEYLYSIHVQCTQWVASLSSPNVSLSAALPLPAATWSSPNVFGIVEGPQIGATAKKAVDTMVDEFVDACHKANPNVTAFQGSKAGKTR